MAKKTNTTPNKKTQKHSWSNSYVGPGISIYNERLSFSFIQLRLIKIEQENKN